MEVKLFHQKVGCANKKCFERNLSDLCEVIIITGQSTLEEWEINHLGITVVLKNKYVSIAVQH